MTPEDIFRESMSMMMSPERQRRFDRLPWRERIGRLIEMAPPFAIGAALLLGLLWLRIHGGPAWTGLTIAAAAAFAKPALMMLRVLETRRRGRDLD